MIEPFSSLAAHATAFAAAIAAIATAAIATAALTAAALTTAASLAVCRSFADQGGLVQFKKLQYSSFPSMEWLLASRTGDAAKAEPLYAFAFHAHRAWAHKPNAARIALIALLSTLGVSDKMKRFVCAVSTISTLGKVGSSMFADRYVEGINRAQQQRQGKFAAFERALTYQPHLIGMMHVDHAFTAAEDKEAGLDDPLRPTMLNAGEAVRQALKERIGTDLTVETDRNNCFHTVPRTLRSHCASCDLRRAS